MFGRIQFIWLKVHTVHGYAGIHMQRFACGHVRVLYFPFKISSQFSSLINFVKHTDCKLLGFVERLSKDTHFCLTYSRLNRNLAITVWGMKFPEERSLCNDFHKKYNLAIQALLSLLIVRILMLVTPSSLLVWACSVAVRTRFATNLWQSQKEIWAV